MRRHQWILGTSLVLGALIAACSDGGPSTAPIVLRKTVYWAPPPSFADDSPLVPSRDLQGVEIYIKQGDVFGVTDNPVVTAPPLDTSYNLGNLNPLLSKGATYYLSMRMVTLEGMKSDFSPAVSFSLP